MADSTELDILIKTKMGAEGARAAATNLKALQGNAKQVQTSLQQSNTTLAQMSTKLLLISGTAMAAMVKSAKDYVTNVGTSEATSRRWLANTYAMESAYNRIGRIFAGQLIPYMETITKGAATAATVLEKNPKIANAAIQGSALGIGILALSKIFPALVPLLQGPVAAVGIGQVVATAIGGGPGAALGKAMGASDAATADKSAMSLLDLPKIFAQAVAVGAGATSALTKGPEAGNATFLAVAKFFGLLPKAATAAKDAADNTAMDVYSTQQLQAMRGQVRADEQQDRALKIQTAKMTRDFNIQQQYAQEDFDRQRMRANRDFNLQLGFSEQDFYRQRFRAARDFNIQMARNEQDHQISVSRAAYDHEFEMFQIGMTGDAWSYFLAQRSYNLQKSRDEEDFQRQQSRASADFQRSEGDATVDYNISRARQLQQFAISQADALQDFNIQRQRAKDQFQVQLGDMLVQYNEERMARKQAFMDQMNDLYGEEQARKILLSQFNQANLADLQNTINAALSGADTYKTTPIPTIPQYAEGGPVLRTGLIYAHAGETVIDTSTSAGLAKYLKQTQRYDNTYGSAQSSAKNPIDTSTSEGLVKYLKQTKRYDNTYSQGSSAANSINTSTAEGLVKYLKQTKQYDNSYNPAEAAGRMGGGSAAGGRSGTTIIWNDHRTFDSRLSAEDRQLIQRDTVDFVLASIP